MTDVCSELSCERKMLMKDSKFKNVLIIIGFHWPLFYIKT